MQKLTPRRRLAVLAAAVASCTAATPVLLSGHLSGRGHDFFFGLAAGIALPLLGVCVLLMRRERSACGLS